MQAAVLPSRSCNLEMDKTKDAEPPLDVEAGSTRSLSILMWPALALELWVGHILWRHEIIQQRADGREDIDVVADGRDHGRKDVVRGDV